MKPIPLSVATKCTGHSSHVEGMGSLVFKGEGGKTVIVNGVFFSPNTSCTLIAPAALIRAGGKLYSEGNDILIFNALNIPVLRATLCPSMLKWNLTPYLIETAQEVDMLEKRDLTNELLSQDRSSLDMLPQDLAILTTALAATDLPTGNVPDQHCLDLTNLLHSAFGHIGSKRLKQFVQQRFGSEARKSINGKFCSCQHCYIAKSTRQSSFGSREQLFHTLDTVTAGLMGQFDEAIPHRGRYALTIRDIGSSYGECHIITQKSDASAVLLHVLAAWETKTGKKIKVFCSDNGGEFCNNTIKAWCQLCGITHKKSLPYHHEQKGSIKRYN
ncbi:hypothetical protein O181_028395 [Austropuccinia psidii MF-1]|uniref:Integrase catalytic domain-containing protein n=1 Tax=Austropuccinia psidii MF-1 TaxID=1389203 RepID=A0A9Q3H453_9BASI|nr:hypothetical protein [Austropuccinia psidii MF-1]